MFTQLNPKARELMKTIRRFNRLHWAKSPLIADLDLRPNEVFLLLSLARAAESGGEGIRASDLSSNIGVSAAHVAQIITSLESRGLVVRELDKADRRVVRVKMTEEGTSMVRRAGEAFESAFNGLVNRLGEQECDRLIELLNKANEYFIEFLGGDQEDAKDRGGSC